MTPIERASAAIVEALRAQGDLCDDCGEPEFAQVDGSFRVEPLARAVLAAIREPSEGMKMAGAKIFADVVDGMIDGDFPTDARDAWVDMIDAALEEG